MILESVQEVDEAYALERQKGKKFDVNYYRSIGCYQARC
jgi:hypothetical protein